MLSIGSGSKRFLQAMLRAFFAGLCCVSLAAGCSSEMTPGVTLSVGRASDATSVSVGSSVSTADTPQRVTSRWPPGVEAVVLTAASGLYVIDAQGIRWAEENEVADGPSTAATLHGPPIASRLDGVALSSDDQLLAYVRAGEELVARSVRDGSIVHRAAVQTNGHTTLRAISSDGMLAALVTVDPQTEAENPGGEVPWTVTVVDLSTGRATVEDSLAEMVRQRIEGGDRCGLTTLHWLLEDKMLIGVGGDPYETYLCDPMADTLVRVPGLDYVWSCTPGGLVLGASAAGPGQAMVWNAEDGFTESIVLDPEWPFAGQGSINADGTALVLMVARSAEAAEHGWQVFRRLGTEWRPASPVAEVDWMYQSPMLLNKDGTKAWTVAPQSTANNETVLLSQDFVSGAWELWFRSEDMDLSWDSFHFVGVVLKD